MIMDKLKCLHHHNLIVKICQNMINFFIEYVIIYLIGVLYEN